MCGIFGVYGANDAVTITVAGLHALQHRGQEAFGVGVFDGQSIQTARKVGLVSDSLARRDFLDALPGSSAIGHVRYSTVGKKDGTDTERTRNAQPLHTITKFGEIAIVHNGTLTNAKVLKRELLEHGYSFQSDTDTEVALKLIGATRGKNLIDRIQNALPKLEGSFAFVILTPKKLIGIRDKHGIRPLVFGRRNGAYLFASETCALDVVGAEYVQEVKPGEIFVIEDNLFASYFFDEITKPTPCIFELAYFSRPDSLVFGRDVTKVRKNIGKVLAQEHSVNADIVIPVPDSGVPAAQGFAQESNIPFEPLGLVRNHYVGRTFIEPGQDERMEKIDMKLTVNKNLIYGKNIVLVDDSLVRGNTMRLLLIRMRRAGVKSVHLRIAYPPWRFPCFAGIDTPTKEELFAYDCKTNDDIVQKVCTEIGADSIGFISLTGLYRACDAVFDVDSLVFCNACVTGNYPIKLID
jgi:amidophosphoribosyltransferase